MSLHFVEDLKVQEYLTKIQEIIPEVEVKLIMGAERVFIEKTNPTLQKFKSVMEGVLDREVTLVKENGSSDARFFTHMNIPIIITRPAGDDAEGINERVSLTSLEKIAQTLMHFIQNTLNK